MKNLVSKVYDKAEEILLTDKLKSPSKISEILSSEIYYVLKQYFEISKESFSSQIKTLKSGEVDINFSFKAKRVLIKRIVSDN